MGDANLYLDEIADGDAEGVPHTDIGQAENKTAFNIDNNNNLDFGYDDNDAVNLKNQSVTQQGFGSMLANKAVGIEMIENDIVDDMKEDIENPTPFDNGKTAPFFASSD